MRPWSTYLPTDLLDYLMLVALVLNLLMLGMCGYDIVQSIRHGLDWRDQAEARRRARAEEARHDDLV